MDTSIIKNKKVIVTLFMSVGLILSTSLIYFNNKKLITDFEYSIFEIKNSKKFNYMSKLRIKLDNKLKKNIEYNELIGR